MYRPRIVTAVLVVAVLAGCAAKEEGFEIPRGVKVTVDRQDGAHVVGTLQSVDATAVFVMKQGGEIERIPQEQVAAIHAVLLESAASARPVAKTEKPRRPAPAAPATAQANAADYRDFRVPAGTLLPIELRGELSSASAHQRNVIRGRLVRPLVAEGVELVPAGAIVFGTVTEVIDAERNGERSRIAVSFQVLEHPETGSRVTVRTNEVAFESQEVVSRKTPAGTPAVQVALQPGSNVSATLLDPVTVRIPVS